jgi:hypothetical protein
MADNTKLLIAGGAIAAIGTGIYFATRKKTSSDPASVNKISVRYYTNNGSFTVNSIVLAEITWKNIGGAKIAPKFQLDIKRDGLGFLDWTDGSIKTASEVEPGETGTVIVPSMAIPGDWNDWHSHAIDVKIMLIGQEGTAFDTDTIALESEVQSADVLSVEYQTQTAVLGSPIVAVVTVKNTGGATYTPRFRLDLKGSATVNEGSVITGTPILAGQTGQVTISSDPIPGDWSGRTITTRVMELGIEHELTQFSRQYTVTENPNTISVTKTTDIDSVPENADVLPGTSVILGFGLNYSGPVNNIYAVIAAGSRNILGDLSVEPTIPVQTFWLGTTGNGSNQSLPYQVAFQIPANAKIKGYAVRVQIMVGNDTLVTDVDTGVFSVIGNPTPDPGPTIGNPEITDFTLNPTGLVYYNQNISYDIGFDTGESSGTGIFRIRILWTDGTDWYIFMDKQVSQVTLSAGRAGNITGSFAMPWIFAGNFTVVARLEIGNKVAEKFLFDELQLPPTTDY